MSRPSAQPGSGSSGGGCATALALVMVVGVAALLVWLWLAPTPSEPKPRVEAVVEAGDKAPPAQPVVEAPSPPAEEPFEPGPSPPPVADGARVEIALSEPAATLYGGAVSGDNEQHYRGLLREVAGPDAIFSADLGRAAREFVFAATELGREPTSDIRDFLLRSSGALAGDTTFQHATSGSDAGAVLKRVLRDAIADPIDGDGPLIVGIGEVFVPARKVSRHIGVVATRLPIALQPLPRRVERGAPWLLRGRLLVPVREIEALVLAGDGSMREAEVKVDGDKVEVLVDVGDAVGAVDVQLVGQLPKGPGKLVQVRVEVGRPLPERAVFYLPADETGLRDARDAAALAWKLLNDDRRAAGLPALSWDPALAPIAEDHSRDMRDNGFFGHRSPSTGLHSDRLARAGYAAARSAENLALNVSIGEAERGLLASLGHRRNLLGKGFSHGAVGVVGEERTGGGRRWWLTQLFSRPMRPIDTRAEADAFVAAIDQARRRQGLASLQLDPGLAAVATTAAADAARGPLKGVGDAALESARDQRLLGRRLRAWTAQTATLDEITPPPASLVPEAERIGVGMAQERTEGGGVGSIGVVVLIGE